MNRALLVKRFFIDIEQIMTMMTPSMIKNRAATINASMINNYTIVNRIVLY